MMENIDRKLYEDCYKEYVNEFCALPLSQKHQEIIKELKTMIAFTNKLCDDYNVSCDMLMSREMVDTQKEHYSEDDFAKSVYAYLSAFKEVYGTFLKSYVDDNYVSSNEDIS